VPRTRTRVPDGHRLPTAVLRADLGVESTPGREFGGILLRHLGHQLLHGNSTSYWNCHKRSQRGRVRSSLYGRTTDGKWAEIPIVLGLLADIMRGLGLCATPPYVILTPNGDGGPKEVSTHPTEALQRGSVTGSARSFRPLCDSRNTTRPLSRDILENMSRAVARAFVIAQSRTSSTTVEWTVRGGHHDSGMSDSRFR